MTTCDKKRWISSECTVFALTCRNSIIASDTALTPAVFHFHSVVPLPWWVCASRPSYQTWKHTILRRCCVPWTKFRKCLTTTFFSLLKTRTSRKNDHELFWHNIGLTLRYGARTSIETFIEIYCMRNNVFLILLRKNRNYDLTKRLHVKIISITDISRKKHHLSLNNSEHIPQINCRT